jgi:hypothetical protein
MKNLIRLLAGGTLLILCVQSVATGAPVTRRGPDTLRYVVRNHVGPTEFGPPTVDGFFELQYTQRGDVVRERMILQVSGLETNATVSLTAGIGDDPANVVTAAHLATDKKGRLRGTFLSTQPAPARPSKLQPIPELMLPLTDVGAICIEDSSGQLVANAGVQDAYKIQYIARRNLVSVDPAGTAAGSIALTANQRGVKFTLLAGGLAPSTEYTLYMNGTAVGVVTSNPKGLVRIRDWPTDAPPILQLRSLELVGPDGPVLNTTFPRVAE